MELDRDLQALQEVRDLARRGKRAEGLLRLMDQRAIDRLTEAVSRAGAEHAARLGRMAAEETGFGRADHKEIKNRFAAVTVYEAIRDMKTVGILAEHPERRVVDMGVGMGLIAGLVPSTNPTSTVIYKTLIALKAGNPIVFSPHPGALKCILETVGVLRRAVEEAGGPADAVACLAYPTLEATDALMRHPAVRLILATGGPGMVRAAYSSGTPAIGVGAGNGPAYIHHTADVDRAVKRIFDSKTFDNGIICASEQSIVTTRAMASRVMEAVRRQGGWMLTPEQKEKLEHFMSRPGGGINPAIVGKTVDALAKKAGLGEPPAGARLILAAEEHVGDKYPFSAEKLAPMLAFYVEEDEAAALKRCVEILDYEGAGHTFIIHTEDRAAAERFARAVPASRVLVNAPGSLGGIGAATGLFPALTLGCGAVGGSSSSNNIGPMDLINIKRIAWGTKELDDLKGGKSAYGDGGMIDRLVEEIMKRMQ